MDDFTNAQVTEVSGVQASNDAGSADTPRGTDEVTGVAAPTAAPSIIPAERDRPTFVVVDDWCDEAGRPDPQSKSGKYRPGVWYFGIKASRQGGPPQLTQQWICSPLHVDAVTTDPSDGNFGRQLRFRTTLKKWRNWAMPMELLKGDGSELRGELLSMGVEIDPAARHLLLAYLQATAPERRIRCALQTGWDSTDGKAFVLPDTVIGPRAASVIYQNGERGHDEYTQAGTLPGWQAGVASRAVGNPLLMLGLSAGFAGPVLARCHAESGGIHFVDHSSAGKTSIVKAACSVWGGPNFKRSWRATTNGMEGVAALFNDSLLALDEIGECDPREVGTIVYSLGNGQGKQRASRTGSARSVARWRCSVLSSGEHTLGTTMAEGGHRIKAGQSVRLLDVPSTRTYGAWDDLQGHDGGAAFSDALCQQAATHYGHAGRAFLERLTRDHDADFTEMLDAIKARPEFQVAPDAGQDKRAAARFALLALAGELATEYGVTGWPEGAAIDAAAIGFKAWRTLRGGGNLERDQVADRMLSFIERHGDSRFSNVDGDDEHRAAMVRDRAGWWQDEAGRRLYLLTADGMREAMKGIDFSRALDGLQEAGAIEAPGADGKRARTRRIQGRTVKVYVVDPARLEGARGAT